jgi:hypothetical protein
MEEETTRTESDMLAESVPVQSDSVMIPSTSIILNILEKVPSVIVSQPGYKQESVVFSIDKKFHIKPFTTRTFPQELVKMVITLFNTFEGVVVNPQNSPVTREEFGTSGLPDGFYNKPWEHFSQLNEDEAALFVYNKRRQSEYVRKAMIPGPRNVVKTMSKTYRMDLFSVDALLLLTCTGYKFQKYRVDVDVIAAYVNSIYSHELMVDWNYDDDPRMALMMIDTYWKYYEHLLVGMRGLRDMVAGRIEQLVSARLVLATFSRDEKVSEFLRLLNVRTNVFSNTNRLGGELVRGNANRMLQKRCLALSMNALYQLSWTIPDIEHYDASTLVAIFIVMNKFAYSELTVQTWRNMMNYLWNHFALPMILGERRRMNNRGRGDAAIDLEPIPNAQRDSKSGLLVALNLINNRELRQRMVTYFSTLGTGRLTNCSDVFVGQQGVSISERYSETTQFGAVNSKLHAGDWRTVRLTGDRVLTNVAMNKFREFAEMTRIMRVQNVDLASDSFRNASENVVVPIILVEMAREQTAYREYNENFNRMIDILESDPLCMPITDLGESQSYRIDISRDEILSQEFIAEWGTLAYQLQDLSHIYTGWNILHSINEAGRSLKIFTTLYYEVGLARHRGRMTDEEIEPYQSTYYSKSEVIGMAVEYSSGNAITSKVLDLMREGKNWDWYMAMPEDECPLESMRDIATLILLDPIIWGFSFELVIGPPKVKFNTTPQLQNRDGQDRPNQYAWSNVADVEDVEEKYRILKYSDINRLLAVGQRYAATRPFSIHIRHVNVSANFSPDGNDGNQLGTSELLKALHNRGNITVSVDVVDQEALVGEDILNVKEVVKYGITHFPYLQLETPYELYGLVDGEADVINEAEGQPQFAGANLVLLAELTFLTEIKIAEPPRLRQYA